MPLSGNTIGSTYIDLLQVSNSNAGIDSTLRRLTDGEDTNSLLELSTAEINSVSGYTMTNKMSVQTGVSSNHTALFAYNDSSNVHVGYTSDSGTTETTSYLSTVQDVVNAKVDRSLYFDGTDDYVDMDLLAAELVSTTNTKGTIVWRGKIHDFTTNYKRLWNFGDTDGNTFIQLSTDATNYKITCSVRLVGTTQWGFTTDNTFSEDIEYSIVLVQDGTKSVLYINGVNEPLTFSNETDNTAWFDVTTDIDNGRLGCHSYDNSGNANFLNCTVSYFDAWNYDWTAAEVEQFYLTGIVPEKYQGADQTAQTSGTLTIGKKYRLTDWITNDDFTNVGAASNTDGVEFTAIGTTPTTWTNSSVVDNIGCVSNYPAQNISSTTWYDNSGNGLNGTVSGAVVVNAGKSYMLQNSEVNTTGTTLVFEKNRADATVVTADRVGTIIAKAHDGTDYHTGIAKIDFKVTGTVADNRTPGEIRFWTAADAASSTMTHRWTMDDAGILQSNGAQTIQTSTGQLDIKTAAGNGDIVLTPNGSGDVILDGHWNFNANALTSLTDNNTTITAYAGKNVTVESVTFDGGDVGISGTLDVTGATVTNDTLSVAKNITASSGLTVGVGGNVLHARKFTITHADLTEGGDSFETEALFTCPAGGMVNDVYSYVETAFAGGNTTCTVQVGDSTTLSGFTASHDVFGTGNGVWISENQTTDKGPYLYDSTNKRFNKIYTSDTVVNARFDVSGLPVDLTGGTMDIYVVYLEAK